MLAGVAPRRSRRRRVKAGIEAWQRADYAGAVAIWRPLAEKGDADAAFNLGQAYRLGRGVPTNLAAAQTWFERAARQGPCRCPDHARPAAVPERQPGRRPALAQGGRRAGRAARAAGLRHRAVQRRRRARRTRSSAMPMSAAPRRRAWRRPRTTLAQLDQLMPLEQRKKGVALAMAKAKAAPPPSSGKAGDSQAKPAQAAAAEAGAGQAGAAPPSRANAGCASGDAATGGSSSAHSRSAARPRRCISKLAGNSALAGRQPFYVPRRGHPAPGRAVRQAARRRRRRAMRSKQACFPVAGEII